jgi:hypothetical protein
MCVRVCVTVCALNWVSCTAVSDCLLQWNLDETENNFQHAVCAVTDVATAYFVLKIT